MCFILEDHQFKTSRHNYRLIYMNLIVTTNQKPTIDTQKTKRKEPEFDTKENHQTTRKEAKRRNREELQKQPENK